MNMTVFPCSAEGINVPAALHVMTVVKHQDTNCCVFLEENLGA